MNDKPRVTTLHAFVEGHVQGVGFRYFVKENADTLTLNGWVRNRYDGSVELFAEGSRETLEKLLEIVRIGPTRSMVTNVKCEWDNAFQRHSQFSFLPTE
jgi:acylphosphatase